MKIILSLLLLGFSFTSLSAEYVKCRSNAKYVAKFMAEANTGGMGIHKVETLQIVQQGNLQTFDIVVVGMSAGKKLTGRYLVTIDPTLNNRSCGVRYVESISQEDDW